MDIRISACISAPYTGACCLSERLDALQFLPLLFCGTVTVERRTGRFSTRALANKDLLSDLQRKDLKITPTVLIDIFIISCMRRE